MASVHTIIAWVLSNKLITFLSLTTLIFFVCTVSLGSQNASLLNEVEFYRKLTSSSSGEPNTSKNKTTTTNPGSTITATMTPENPNPEKGWRLPHSIKPLSYDLTLNPDLNAGVFSGSVSMKIQVNESISQIKLNTNSLQISDIKIMSRRNLVEERPSYYTDDKEILTITLRQDLRPGTYEVGMNFNGNMTNRIVGFYRSSYVENGTNRYIATSKLEPTYARQAFPCFDEPNFKANYTVHMRIPKKDGYIALSNMDVARTESIENNTYEMVHFNTSVPMSTYVTCFIVCDFNYTEDIIKPSIGKPIPLKVYATPAQVDNTKYALEIAKKVTEYYVEYFGIEYPLPKLDMIAIPDFVSGAMEHWGLVTYRETALLYDKERSNAANQQRVASVVAHELAHMWFGNLVTLNWWNDLWLNEGFATYMQFKALDKIIDNWGMTDQFLIDQLHSVLNFDSTLATHPIVVTVTTPDEITEIFDSISYNKGASILRMLENAIGEEKFKEGIRKYLKAHKYSNAVTKDLWRELESAELQINVEEVMNTWTVQMGYPVVSIFSHDPNTYILKQTRFLADPDNKEVEMDSSLGYKWTIPITYITDLNNNSKLIWFDKDKAEITLNLPGIKWLKLNHQQVGYYRVNYTPQQWTNLTKEYLSLQAADRTNLLEDSFSLAKAGHISYNTPLDMTMNLTNETEYVPWTVAIRKFSELKKFLKNNQTIYKKFQEHVLSVITPIYEKLKWTGNAEEAHQNKLLRGKVLDAACLFGHKDCIETAESKFKAWLNESTPIELDVKTLVYEYGMANILPAQWNIVFETYVKEIDASEKLKLLNGLASIKDRDLLHLLLDKARDEAIVRSQDYFTCLQYISQNEFGTDIIWDHVRENWQELVERFGLNDRNLGRLIPSITSSFVTKTKLSEMETFFKQYPDAGAGKIARKTALENVKNNIKWIEKYQKNVETWLNK